MVDEIKQIMDDYLNQSRPCDWITGTVISGSNADVTVRIDQKTEIPPGALTVVKELTDRTIHVTATDSRGDSITSVTIPGLRTGDVVAMIRKTGGQEYLVIGRINL